MKIGCSIQIQRPQITITRYNVVNTKKNKILPNFDQFSGYFWENRGQVEVLCDLIMYSIIYEYNLRS